MTNHADYKDMEKLIDTRDFRLLRQEFSEHFEVDIAHFIETLSSEKATVAFRTLPKEMAVEVFAELSHKMQQHIIEAITDQELAVIIEDLFVDDAVDMLEELPANVVKRILLNAQPETRELINQFLRYPQNSAGSIMTAEFVDLKKAMTVNDAITHIRRTGADRETIYTCYVINERRILEGVVSIKDLLLSDDNSIVNDIMDTDVIKVATTDDREDVARLFSKYDLLALPVVDQENRLVGIVTVDDAVDVIQQEATEDFEKMAAMLPSEQPYLKAGIFTHAKNRLAWLLILMVSGMITGGILGRYEKAFAVMPLLVTFIPMLTDTGGNSGSQSSTLIIRGMALSEIQIGDFFKILWKEISIGIIVGVALSAINFVRIVITYPGNPLMALVVSLALLATVVIAKAIGGILPIIARVIKVDPAIMASPLITTIVDGLSLVIYMAVAETFLF